MKKLVAKDNVECMACLECVQACSKAYYKEFHQDLACLQIVAEGYSKAKAVTCSQCGKCAEACPNNAITQNAKTGVYMLSKKLCTGCGKCAEACPEGLIVKSEKSETASKCTACGICVKACPAGVLEVVDA